MSREKSQRIDQYGASTPRMILVQNGASVPMMQAISAIDRGASVPVMQEIPQPTIPKFAVASANSEGQSRGTGK